MREARVNLVYVFFAVIVIILIAVTIGLQMALLSRNDASTAPEPSAQRAQQNPLPILNSNPFNRSNDDGDRSQIAMAVRTHTPSPLEEAVPPTPEPPTPAPPTSAPPTFETSISPTAANSDTPTPIADADFVIGYIPERASCGLVTEILVMTMAREYEVTVDQIAFDTPDELFAHLAHAQDDARSIDFTPCYVDPNDRGYLMDYETEIEFIHGPYSQIDEESWYLMGAAAFVSQVRFQNRCIYQFLRQVEFADRQFATDDATLWAEQNAPLLAEWTRCAAQ